MKTPWRATYDAGERIDSALESGFASSQVVGLFYFIAVAAIVFGTAAVIQWISPGSSLARFVDANLDSIFVIALFSFVFYTIGLSFWHFFFPSQAERGEKKDG